MTQTSQDAFLPVVIMIVGFLAIASSVLILFGQAGFWLRYGVWPEVPLAYVWPRLGWRLPVAEWAGVTKMIGWLCDCPLSCVLFGLGLILGALGLKLGR
jgi:hypothetical protein